MLQGYDYTTIVTRSTNYNRTIMSTVSHYLGLFQFGSGPQLESVEQAEKSLPPFNLTFDPRPLGLDALPLAFQPIPVQTMLENDDEVLDTYSACPEYGRYSSSHPDTEDQKNISKIFEPNVDKVAEIYNLDRSKLTVGTLSSLYDILIADYYANNQSKIPFGSPLFLNITYSEESNFAFIFRDWYQIQVTMTPFLNELIDRIDGKFDGRYPNMKWYTYSAHDTNLYNLLVAFNISISSLETAS
eukprot:TRINITY_DN9705_c0_g1_i2.p1 TRINITY_DN9705_c0_g1~~TRINITY_DN9705_c0_g1_i2.p1  ORF type:complete len:243 (+),score=36.94 TRINITY_DN9705_c0_g1_i2:170-898(+)